MLSIIVAIADNNAIGKDNKLLCHISDDLKRFKRITTGHTIIMGKNTYLSIGRPLPNRRNIVVSKSMKNSNIDGIEVISDINDLEPFVTDENENFIIGGESIYRQMLPKCDKIYVTRIHKDFEGDTFFPEINPNEWKIIDKEEGPSDLENDFKYEYITYQRAK